MLGLRPKTLAARLVKFFFLASSVYLLFGRNIFSSNKDNARMRLKRSVNNVLDAAIQVEISKLKVKADQVVIIRDLQSALFCYIHSGRWEATSNALSSFLRRKQTAAYFIPNDACLADHSFFPETNPGLSLCSSLSGKKVLLVGPATTYHLHERWLSVLEVHGNEPDDCLGPEFCVFHHTCRPPFGIFNDSDFTQLEGRMKKIPSKRQLAATGSSLLHYVASSTLHASNNSTDPAYNIPILDYNTGVRVQNAYWLRYARKSDVVVMNRGPLPAPAWTYAEKIPGGNWTFARQLLQNTTTTHLISKSKLSLLMNICNAAVHSTLTFFIPEVLQALHTIQSDPELQGKPLIWHGSWYIQPQCSNIRMPEAVPLLHQFWLDSPLENVAIDPWSFYYNLQGIVRLPDDFKKCFTDISNCIQVYMHDYLLAEILPHFGVIFFPQTIPVAAKYMNVLDIDIITKERRSDCIRYPWSMASGKAIEDSFFGGMSWLAEALKV